MLEREIKHDALHHPETFFKVIEGTEKVRAQKLFDELCSGSRGGMLLMLGKTGIEPEGVGEGEAGAHVEGLSFLNGLPIAAIIRAVVDQYGLTISDVVDILATTRTSGTVIEH